MTTNPTLKLAQRGWLIPMLDLARLGSSYYRLVFRGAGLRSGIFEELAKGPCSADELSEALGFDLDLVKGLEAWLDAGVSFGELARNGDRYALRRRALARALQPRNDPIRAFIEEMADLQHRLLIETPERLRSGRPFNLSDTDAATIARSSVMGEPWITATLERHVPRSGQPQLLEVGCGAGSHLRTAASLNPQLLATGVELQEAAAELARDNLAAWGLTDRIKVITGDIRDLAPEASYDLITLHQNIYYFAEAEQESLFRHLRGFLKPGGTLIITTIVRDAGISSATLDLWGAMTKGASRLPTPDSLVACLRKAELTNVHFERVGRHGPYGAFVGMQP